MIERRDRWSWVVAVSCCWINIFIFGLFRSFGVLYLAVINTYHCSNQLASWPFTLAAGVASLSALPAGFLTHYFSIRSISCFGVLVSSFAIAICFFAQDIYFIIIFLGIMQGIGIGFSVLLLPAIISQYFEEKRAIACGISYSGATIGSFIFPFLTEWLLNIFGLQGTLLLMGGITSHAMIGTLLLRPLLNKVNGGEQRIVPNSTCDETLAMIDTSDCKRSGISEFHCNQKVSAECTPSERITFMQDVNASEVTNATRITINNRMSNCGDVLCGEQKSGARNVHSKSFLRTIRRHIINDCVIIRNPYFSFVTITYVAYCFVYIVYLIILPAFAIERGLTLRQGTVLLSIFSVTDLIGRLLPGWLSYQQLITNKTQFVVSMLLMSFAFAATPIIAHSFSSFCFLTLIIGFCVGCQMVLPPVILSEFLGAKNTAIAFGFANFLGSFFSPLRALLIGYYVSKSGRHENLLLAISAIAFCSACVWLIEIPIKRNYKK